MLADVEALLASNALVVDACRQVVREQGEIVPLATRPVLFEIARLRTALRPLADVSATKQGFMLAPRRAAHARSS